MKKGFGLKEFGIVIVIILIVSIVGFFLTSKKNNNENENGNNGNNGNGAITNTAITMIYEAEITQNEQVYELNGNNVTVALDESGQLLINNTSVEVKANYAYVTNQIIIFGNKTACGTVILYVIDRNGNSIPFIENDYKLIDFRMYENKCVARNVGVCECKGTFSYCEYSYDVVLNYDGTQLLLSNLF